MTPALLARVVALVLPWHDGPVDFDGGTATVYAGPDRWGDWSRPPTRTTARPGERAAMWYAGVVVVVLVCRDAVEVDG